MCESLPRLVGYSAALLFAVMAAAACGSETNGAGGTGAAGGEGGEGGEGGGGGVHALAGTWEGHLFPAGRFGGRITLSIDSSGEITEILSEGSASTSILGGEVDDGPDVYTMTWDIEALGPIAFPFLTDEGLAHAAMAPLVGTVALIGAVERDGSATTTFFESDVIGSWSGYGYAYDQDALDFAPFSPVTAEATSGTPIPFSVTMPSGTITGVLPNFANLFAFWGGTAAVSGASVVAIMSPDKQFIAVEAIPVTYDNLEDLTFFALNREP
jgi:hypothetical protein